MFKVPEKYRVKTGSTDSKEDIGNNGHFIIKSLKLTCIPNIICSDMEGWEHVSVSLPHRCLTWEEMCIIKAMFWSEDDFVVQMHPVKDDYVNNHPYCLHLWRKTNTNNFCEKPPSILVGIKA